MNEVFRAMDAKPGDDEEDDGLVEMTDFFDPVAALLSSIGGEAENLTEELRKYGIKYEHLSGLCDEDLTILGLKNKKIREEVLAEIASLPNQVEHYDVALKKLNIKGYIRDVLLNISTHLDSLNALLVLTQLRISAHHVENVRIEENKYASEVAVSVCRKLQTKTIELENLLNDVRQGQFSKDKTLKRNAPCSTKSCFFNKVVLVSLLLSSAYLGGRFFKQFVK